MSGHIPPERMHDLVDGLVPEAERRALDEHLSSCPACRDELARLRELVGALGALPTDAETPSGLWAGIEARIGATAPADATSAATVVPFPGTRQAARRVSLTLPQLAAAAVVVAVVSAGLVWATLSGRGGAEPELARTEEADAGATARMVASGGGYAQALAELESIVQRGRASLAPETLAALERSLATVDSAIAEVEEALRNDPNSELLARLLATHQGAKLRTLRHAAARLEPRV